MKNTRFYYIQKELLLIIFVLNIFFISCSTSPEAIAKKTYNDMVSKDSQGKLKLIDFEKTNGVKGSFFGKEIYELEYKATIDFVESCWKDEGPTSANFQVKEKEPKGWDAWNHLYKYFDKGSKMTYNGKIALEKTDNGWRPLN